VLWQPRRAPSRMSYEVRCAQMLPVFGREVEGGQRVAIPQASANIEGMAPPAFPSGDWRGRQQDSAIGTIGRAQWRASTLADRRQAGWLAKEPARTHWPTAPGADLAPHTRD
jgi:hypothetical protein